MWSTILTSPSLLTSLSLFSPASLVDYYENTGNQKLEITHNKRYKKYQGLIDKQDERLMSNIKKDINMMILSENL